MKFGIMRKLMRKPTTEIVVVTCSNGIRDIPSTRTADDDDEFYGLPVVKKKTFC